MDPEDVAALLEPYHARVKSELERHGGTVEKFIGDAAMALFGAPIAHEDDPERAVRAALAIRRFAEDEDIELRIGIATGEALVTLVARPDQGETMATGDVVNTAARLQAAAPVNGILVSEKTVAATSEAIEFARAESVAAKGKSQPVPVWEVRRARSRFTLDRLHGTPLVGRARELDSLRDALARASEERQTQLVTVVGVPGIGKSRLVYELSRAVDEDTELISWRQGRCLPYGEGVTFWALGEIVKAQAGILETDDSAVVERKLAAATHDAWVRLHLRPLLGLVSEPPEEGARGEAFAAWRAFLEGVAHDRPLVVVFEDLHWADEDLLDFVDYLVDWASGVALLVVCTARPELLERRPGWGGGKSNALTTSLSPLSDDDTTRMVAALTGRNVLAAETREALLVRAGGNPLYAEQYARLLEDRPAAELALPETVQGMIAARLDALPAEQKQLLQDAAVVGKSFWLGALVAMSGKEPRALEKNLHALERKGFVRRKRESSVEGNTEYTFLHVLARDVAYGQIPRAPRGEKHRKAAEWLSGLARQEDRSELLAHHYGEALELARAAGAKATDLEQPARDALRAAGDRAFALNAYATAARFYERGLDLSPGGDRIRAPLLLRYARSLLIGLGETRVDIFAEARDAFLEAADREGAAEAETYGASALLRTGRGLEAVDQGRSAVRLLEGLPPSRPKTRVLANLARLLVITGSHEEGLVRAEEALASAHELGIPELEAHALNTIGLGRLLLGKPDAIEPLEESLWIALQHGSPYELMRIYNNLDAGYTWAGQMEDAAAATTAVVQLAERLGLPVTNPLLADAANALLLGRWDDARQRIADVGSSNDPDMHEEMLMMLVADFALATGDVVSARDAVERALVSTREDEDVAETRALLRALLCFAAHIELAAGDVPKANELTDELLSVKIEWARQFPINRIDLALLLLDLDRVEEVELPSTPAAGVDPWRHICDVIVRGQLEVAADRLAELGLRPLEAETRLRAARRLLDEGRRAEADVQLQRALAFWREVGATAYVRNAEVLLAATA